MRAGRAGHIPERVRFGRRHFEAVLGSVGPTQPKDLNRRATYPRRSVDVNSQRRTQARLAFVGSNPALL
jgi:hypothetical protein